MWFNNDQTKNDDQRVCFNWTNLWTVIYVAKVYLIQKGSLLDSIIVIHDVLYSVTPLPLQGAHNLLIYVYTTYPPLRGQLDHTKLGGDDIVKTLKQAIVDYHPDKQVTCNIHVTWARACCLSDETGFPCTTPAKWQVESQKILQCVIEKARLNKHASLERA